MTTNRWGLPHLGLGLGLRVPHYLQVINEHPAVDFFEVTPENFLYTQGRALYVLEQVAERYRLTFHCITINIGSTDPLDTEYLQQVKALADRLHVVYLSDHLCWSGFAGLNLHEIVPLPMTKASLDHVAERVKRVQDMLGRPLFLENSSGLMAYRQSDIPEDEYFARLCEAADCGMLLDLNNLFQGAHNHAYDAEAYLKTLPVERIGYQHVAGDADKGQYLLDTHDSEVDPRVWELYRQAEARHGGRTTLLEWDALLPKLNVLQEEVAKARPFQGMHSQPVIAQAVETR